MSTGLPLLLACLAALESALFARALWLFLAGTVAGGVAVGLIFRGGLTELNRLAEPRHRASVVSLFFAAAYLGMALPAVLTGLISELTGPVDASAYTSGAVAAIVAVALIVMLRTFGVAPAPSPPSSSSDSWCCLAETPGYRPAAPRCWPGSSHPPTSAGSASPLRDMSPKPSKRPPQAARRQNLPRARAHGETTTRLGEHP